MRTLSRAFSLGLLALCTGSAIGCVIPIGYPRAVRSPLGEFPAEEPAPKDTAPRKILVTGSRIPQTVDLSTGMPATCAPLRVYFRSELESTGRTGISAPLTELDLSMR